MATRYDYVMWYMMKVGAEKSMRRSQIHLVLALVSCCSWDAHAPTNVDL